MTVQNYGRTPAMLKEYFVTFSPAEPVGGVAIYGAGETVVTDLGIAPGPAIPVRTAPFFSPHGGAQWCYGYVKYEDVFRVTHTSRFCSKIAPGGLDAQIGGSAAYNEWD